MKLFKIAVFGLMATALTVGSSLAAPEEAKEGERPQGERPDPAARFAAMDTDSSGGVSLAEFKVVHEKRMAAMKERRGDREPPAGRTPRTAEEIFKRLDKDGDGSLTKEEMAATRRGARGQRGGEGQGQRGGRGGQGGGQGGE